MGASETLGYATEALLLAGDLDGAQRQLDEALQIAGEEQRLGHPRSRLRRRAFKAHVVFVCVPVR